MKLKAGSLTVVQTEEGAALTVFDKDPDQQRPPLPNVFRIEPLDALGLLKILQAQEAKFKDTVLKECLDMVEHKRDAELQALPKVVR